MTKCKSFVRQLHLYHFFKLKNKMKTSYRHFYFIRDKPENLSKIKRKLNGISKLKENKQEKLILENEKLRCKIRIFENDYQLQLEKDTQFIDFLVQKIELLKQKMDIEVSKNKWYQKTFLEFMNMSPNQDHKVNFMFN